MIRITDRFDAVPSITAPDADLGFDSGGTIYPHPALVLVPDVSLDENPDPAGDDSFATEAGTR